MLWTSAVFHAASSTSVFNTCSQRNPFSTIAVIEIRFQHLQSEKSFFNTCSQRNAAPKSRARWAEDHIKFLIYLTCFIYLLGVNYLSNIMNYHETFLTSKTARVLLKPSSWFKLVPFVFVLLLVYYLRKHLSFLK